VTFLHQVRRRVLWIVAGVGVTTFAVASMTTLPVWGVVVGAVATIALVLNTMTSRLHHNVCLGCGVSIAELPHGEHGVICLQCGHISSAMHLNDQHTGPVVDPEALDQQDVHGEQDGELNRGDRTA
jgi:hypothetical protein